MQIFAGLLKYDKNESIYFQYILNLFKQEKDGDSFNSCVTKSKVNNI